MKIRPRVLVLIFCFAGSTLLADELPDVSEFKSNEGRFRVLMPGKPVTLKKGNRTFFLAETGQETFRTVNYKSCVVIFEDYPALANADKAEALRFLTSERDVVVRRVKGKLLSSTELSLQGAPIIEFQIDSPPLYVERCRITLVKGRLYKIGAMGTKDFVNSQIVETYIKSFKLTD